MGVVTTVEGRCRKCYSCVRHCPAKAIKVENEQAKVIGELCIACGHCVKVCSQKAKFIERELDKVEGFLREGKAVACLAPSFVAEYHPFASQVVTALRRLGFAAVVEVAYGASLVSEAYREVLAAPGWQRGLISTACPAIVNLVEKYYPELLPRLVPVVSPMVATGRVVKEWWGADTPVVFIGPCVAKKEEARDPLVSEAVDAVLIFRELRLILEERGIEPARLSPGKVDNPWPGLGSIYPLPGGLLRSAALRADILENEIVTVSGKENCLEFLEGLRHHHFDPEFVDILFCEGCINGPVMETSLPPYTRQKAVAEYWRLGSEPPAGPPSGLSPQVDLRRAYTDRSVAHTLPTEEQVLGILRELDKTRPEDELNCGACGYNTCREKAVAVFQGLAENRMCLPYLINHLEKSNRELAYLKDYNKNIVESIAEGIIVINREGIVTTFNDSQGQVTDRSREEVLGRGIYEVLPHLDREEVRGILAQALERGDPGRADALRLRLGKRVLVANVKGYPLREERGEVYGAVLICEDITEKKKMETQLMEANRLASIGRLAAGVAHEINNPLTLISGYTEVLARRMGDAPQASRYLGIITEEVDRITTIVRNLLNFARPSPQELAHYQLNELVAHTLNLAGNQMKKGGIRLELALAKDLPELPVNRNELEQVFLNIILNACQAMPGGGVLSVSTRLTEGPSVQVEFTDTGCGIPEENLHSIFDPFFTTKEVGEGTGLGLSVSYGIVKKYEGSIQVTSEVGRGTTFLINLPVRE